MWRPRGERVSRLIRKALEAAGVKETYLATGVDTVGDIAIVRLEGAGAAEKRRVARAILAEAKTVKCVFEQRGGIEGDFRLRKLRYLAGEKRTLTVHRENGCTYKVDVARCYFSPRLASERLRIAEEAMRGESVLNMFAGVGPFSILVAKRKEAKILSCELNGFACELHEENNRTNKVDKLVRVLNADAFALPKLTRRRFDRILMPHPSQADRFLPTALALAKKGSVIHYYRHALGRNENEAAGNIKTELGRLLQGSASYDVRRVREVGPRWLEMAADIRVT
jgi:tRNA (guanine37-N1)-methyltransferase